MVLPVFGTVEGMDAALPDDVRPRIEGLLAELDRELPDVVSGLHVVGSIALGDYHPGHSDIDLVIVTRHPLGPADVPVIDAVHQRERQAGGSPLQASYLTTSSLATNADPIVPSVSYLNGETSYGTDFEVNPVTWRNLVRHAVAVRGTPTSVWMRDPDDAELAAFCRRNLDEYWLPLVDKVLAEPRSVEARMLEWLGLGPARLAHTIETGEIISKTEAGERMLAAASEAERPAFETALAVRRGEIDPAAVLDYQPIADIATATRRVIPG
ncbi:MAG: nucleotidyltransferase domain-containing protein [Acidimicrobiales bacterium]